MLACGSLQRGTGSVAVRRPAPALDHWHLARCTHVRVSSMTPRMLGPTDPLYQYLMQVGFREPQPVKLVREQTAPLPGAHMMIARNSLRCSHASLAFGGILRSAPIRATARLRLRWRWNQTVEWSHAKSARRSPRPRNGIGAMQASADIELRTTRHDPTRRHCARPIPRFGLDAHRCRPALCRCYPMCRYEAVTRRPALLESTGETYAELAIRWERDAENRHAPAH